MYSKTNGKELQKEQTYQKKKKKNEMSQQNIITNPHLYLL